MLSEKDIENAICQNPEKYLGEKGLRLISRQYRIANYIFDLLFEDRHGAKLIVEIQKGVLDRNHTYKILDYYHSFKENHPGEFVELMVIANEIPIERKRRLSQFGVSFIEIPEAEFSEIIEANIAKIKYPIQVIPPEEEKGRVMSRKGMNPNSLFDKLGVPLKNNRWSWGGIRGDGAVFLRVWQDEVRKEGNTEFVRVTAKKIFQNRSRKHPGYQERLEHLSLVKNGAISYMVICAAKDVHAIPRSIKNFNSDELYIGGKLKNDADGDSWLEIVGRVSVQDIQLPSHGVR
jgi:hypothetical protein